jgi:hypothetical protein
LHFHLSEKPIPSGQYFSAAADWLVFCIVTPNEIKHPRLIAGGVAVSITTKDYVAQQIPRVPSQPWSAPLYDGQAVTQHPRVFCAELLEEQGRVTILLSRVPTM